MVWKWNRWRSILPPSDDEYQRELRTLREAVPVPGIWLFGKTGSGKSSVIHSLTGAEEATIGEGYRPETKTSRRFDFPGSEETLLTFIDTRGLGEASYNPTQDIAHFDETTQLILVTVKVTDHALDSIIDPLRRIRKASSQRPILLIITCLHEATGTADITEGVDPFCKDEQVEGDPDQEKAAIPESLQQLIDAKLGQFEGLYDHVVPVDITRIEDGFANPDFGGDRLRQAILEYLPQAYRQALLSLGEEDLQAYSYRQRRARWQILASSAMAGSAGAVPIPWVDIPVVLGLQSHLAMKLAKIYDQELTAAHWAVLSSAAGSRLAMRMAVREALKFVPWVGVAAGAASSFAFTYALGMSWDWYFADLRGGRVPSADKLKEVFNEQLARGQQLWKAT